MEANAFLVKLIEHNPYSMWISDDQGTLVWLNQACRDLFRIRDEEAIGRYNIFQDEVLEAQGLLPVIRQVFADGKAARFCFEYDASRVKSLGLKDRASLVLDVTISPISDARDRVTHAIFQSIDITENKRAEDALRQSEEKYRLIAENTADVISINDMDLRFTYASPAVRRLRGLTPEEAIQQTLDQILPPESLEITLAAFAEEMKMEASGTADPNRIRTLELEEYRKDGSLIPVEVRLSYLRDKDRKPVAMVAVTRDITERKLAEGALRDSEESALRLAQEHALMAEIGRIIGSTLNIGEVYALFSEKAGRLLPYDRITITEAGRDGGTLIESYVEGEPVPGRDMGNVFPKAGSMTEAVMGIRKGLILDSRDGTEISAKYPGLAPEIKAGYRSFLSVPLISGDRPIGGLHFRAKRPGFYSEKDLALAESIGNQIAGAIANARLYAERKRAEEAVRRSEETARKLARENAVMAEISRIIGSTLNVDEVYDLFAAEARKILEFDKISINLVDDAARAVSLRYVTGQPVEGRNAGDVMPLEGSLTAEGIRTKGGIIYHPRDEGEVAARFPMLLPIFRKGLHSMMSVPLISENRVIGALIFMAARPGAYRPEDLRLAQRVGNQIAGAIANARLYAERKRAEEAVRESERKLMTILQGFSIPSFVIGKDHRIIHWNKALAETSGIEPGEVIGTDRHWKAFYGEKRPCLADLLVDEKADLIPQWYAGKYAKSKFAEGAYEGTDFFPVLGEEGKWLRFTAAAIRDSQGNLIGAIETLEDITERKRAEEELRRSVGTARRLAAENEAVAEIGQIISSTINIEEVYEHFAQEVKKIIPFDRVTVSIFDPEGDRYFILYTSGAEVPGFHKGSCHVIRHESLERAGRIRPGILFQVGAEREARAEEEMERVFPSFLPFYRAGIRSVIRTPLISKDQAMGSLSFLSREYEAYTESDLRVAERIANQIAGAVANAQLFSERKRAEEALRESEERYRVAEKLQEMGHFEWDVAGNRITASPSLESLHGRKPGTFRGALASWFEQIHPEDRERVELFIRDSLRQELTEAEFEFRIVRPDGEVRSLLGRARASYDDQKRPVRVFGAMIDITGRRRAEEALRESEERYRHVVELSPELVAVHSGGKYVYMNPAGLKFLGAKGPEDVIGRPVLDIIHPDFRGTVEERIERTYKERMDVPLIEERYVRLDGRVIDVEVASAPFKHQGRPASLVVARDITERKRAEEALRWSEKETQRLLRETVIMAEIGRIVSSTLDIDEVYERFAAEVKKLVPFDRISIIEVDAGEGTGITIYTAGLVIPGRKVGDFFPLADSATGELLRSRSGLLVRGEGMEEFATRHPSYLPCCQAGVRSLLAAPLVSRDGIVGALMLDSLRPDAYLKQDLKLVETIGNQIAGAVANAQHYQREKRMEKELLKSEERYRL